MAKGLLYFNLLEGGLPAKSSYTVYLDSSLTAVENSYYYDTPSTSYTARQLPGTNGFSAFTEQTLPSMPDKTVFRIRIVTSSDKPDELSFCSAWFKYSDNGYADYIPYAGANGPSNGLYTIVVAGQDPRRCKTITGTTTLFNVPSIKKTIPCGIYLFWGGGYLNGGETYPPIIGRDNIYIGDNYLIRVPTSSTGSSTNYVTYCFHSHNPTYPELECSYINSYGLEGEGVCLNILTGTTKTFNISFQPQENVICTGQMAESISYNGSEFANISTQCLRVGEIGNYHFKHSETNTDTHLVRFSSVKKKNSIILNTVFVANGTVNTMAYNFSGNSTTYDVATTPTFPAASSVSGCNWQAYISDFLNTSYSIIDLNQNVNVNIKGYILSQSGWYYRVVAYDGTLIKNTTSIKSGFTTTIGKLDGAIVFFGKTSNITANSWDGAKKAIVGSSNAALTTKNVYSWAAPSTTSLESIGEFDYE